MSISASRVSCLTRIWIVLLVLIGVVSRIAPFFNQNGRLLKQWPTEDGYLMLTIARNLSLGLGMSTAEGTIPTNGTQPLMTIVYALAFKMVGGSKADGVFLALSVQLLVVSLAAWLLYLLARAVISSSTSHLVPASVAAVWFSSQFTVATSMNCLETGAYALCIVGTMLTFVLWKGYERKAWTWQQVCAFGALLGITFLVRIDAIFFIFAILVCRVRAGFSPGTVSFSRLSAEASTSGVISLLVGMPWLLYNQVIFGSIMPISGTAQERVKGELVGDFVKIVVKVFEYISIIVPIPERFEGTWIVMVLCLIAVALYLAFICRSAYVDKSAWGALLTVTIILMVGWFGYYGMRSTATWFYGRYFFPLSPFLTLITIAVVTSLAEKVPRMLQPVVAISMMSVVLLFVSATNLRLYVNGAQHQHFQVVEWVDTHVSPEVWVGAVQTGTLGFFHDRTINLDGKVNPEALRANRLGQLPQYVIDSKVQYLVDWAGLAKTWDHPPLSRHFRPLLIDEEQNLSVMVRKSKTAGSAL